MARTRRMQIGTAVVPVERGVPSEAASLAQELGQAYLRTLQHYREGLSTSPDVAEAERWALIVHDPEEVAEAPAGQISWRGLGQLIEQDPAQGEAVWQRIKAEAREHLASGHRAAAALEHEGTPSSRAAFLAIRDSFREEWQPRGGMEDVLVDVLAQAHSAYLSWFTVLQVRATVDVKRMDETLKKYSYWEPPRLEEAAALEQAAAMMDRFNKLFLRTLRSLRDLRRYGPVIVQNPAQVNIGTQQVNTVQHAEPPAVLEGATDTAPRRRQQKRGATGPARSRDRDDGRSPFV